MELACKTKWDKAEKMLFPSYNKFWSWVHKEEAKVLWQSSTYGQDVVHYYLLHKGKPVVAVVQLTVDDFYIPKEVAESKLSEDYIAEKAESHDWYKPAVICSELHNLFYKIVEVSAMAGFSTLSPEEAKKLIEMARHVKEAATLLERCVLKAVKGYMSLALSGLAKDERWIKEKIMELFKEEEE